MQYLYGGLPDLGLLPGAALSRAYRRALQRPGDVLGYGDPRGHVSLRTALATMLRSARGLELDEDGIVITRGGSTAARNAASHFSSAGSSRGNSAPCPTYAWATAHCPPMP
jgi:GntR family transcriptional regulator/MocR family aminotransferase